MREIAPTGSGLPVDAGRPEGPAMNKGLRSNGNFRLYFEARIISQLGDQLHVFAISWFVLDLTKSSFHMAALLAVSCLAIMAVAPFGGLIADRLNRKNVMVATDIVQGTVLLALLALQQGHLLSVGMLYAGTIAMGLCSAVFSPAATAIVPGIVNREHIPGAVAAGQAAANICTITGMLLGGALYRLIGIAGVLLLNAVSFFLAAAMESRICTGPVSRTARAAGTASAASPGTAVDAKREPRANRAIRRFGADLRDGLRQVRADRTVFALLMVNTVFTLAVLPIAMVYMPYLFNVILSASPLQAAVPQAATWGGIIIGSAVVARALRRHRPEILISGGLLVLAVHTILVIALLGARTLLGAAWMSAACTAGNAIAGAAGAFFIVPLYGLFHARSIDKFRGRFWGLESSLRTAAMCAGYFIAGTIAQRFPLGLIFAGTGVVLAFLSVLVMRLAASSHSETALPQQP